MRQLYSMIIVVLLWLHIMMFFMNKPNILDWLSLCSSTSPTWYFILESTPSTAQIANHIHLIASVNLSLTSTWFLLFHIEFEGCVRTKSIMQRFITVNMWVYMHVYYGHVSVHRWKKVMEVMYRFIFSTIKYTSILFSLLYWFWSSFYY